jgi:hypothetical protein
MLQTSKTGEVKGASASRRPAQCAAQFMLSLSNFETLKLIEH